LLARWLATPSLLFGTLPPPVEASEVIRHLIEPTPDRADTVLRFVASSGDIDVAVGHLLALRRLIEAEPDSRIQIDVELLDLLIVEVTSNVIAAARRAAMIDPLTGVGNRRALELELEPAIARSERSRRPLAVVYIDLIGLKAVNDRHGHEEGDRALTSFTRALELVKRTGDMGYRVGGDEFVVLLPDTCTRDAERFTSRLASTGAPPFSTGIANTEDDGFDPRRLVRLADVRMLQTRYRTAAESDHAGVSLSS
jgi:diguanylate cyclase (GGDEF)-like protein